MMNVAFLQFLLYDSILPGGNGTICLIAYNNGNKMGPCLKVTITVFPPRLFAICPPKSCLIWLYVKVFNLKLFPELSNVKIKLRQLVRAS